MWNLSEFVKTFMITQNKGEWPSCLALASVTQQSSNKSSNQIYLSLVMILSLKISLWQFETGVREDLERFLPCPNRKCTLKLLKVKKKKKHSSKNERLHCINAFDSRDKYVKKGLHEIIENRIKKAATKRWW